MKSYYKLSQDGQTIEMATVNPNIAEKLNMHHSTDKEIVHGFDGNLYFVDDAPNFKPNYAQKRAMEYPSVQEQLDMLYWDMKNGTKNWEMVISDIKKRYPKD